MRDISRRREHLDGAMELRIKYGELIQKLIQLRKVEYLVVTHGYPYRAELRRKIRDVGREAELVRERLLAETGEDRPEGSGRALSASR